MPLRLGDLRSLQVAISDKILYQCSGFTITEMVNIRKMKRAFLSLVFLPVNLTFLSILPVIGRLCPHSSRNLNI